MMREPPPDLKFKLGDRVTLPYYNHGVGRIVAWRGPFGPRGAQIYDVRFGPKGRRRYIEVREDQLVPAPPKEPKPADPPATPS